MRCGVGIQCNPDFHGALGICNVVNVSTLDDELRRGGPIQTIAAVKMDVEGFECNVMAGGQKLFTDYRPAYIQVEVTFPNTTQCVLDNARRHRYEVPPGLHSDMTIRARRKRSF